VVGCKAPVGAVFSEFRCLNADEKDASYNSPKGMYAARCGLENVTMAWTGPEYMYHMLQHNHVEIPEEGLSMLRLFSLREWHSKGDYGILANEYDEDIQPFVADFDDLRRDTCKSLSDGIDMNDEECEILWTTHYSHIVSKYAADGLLKW
jgi:inositol oxygenase